MYESTEDATKSMQAEYDLQKAFALQGHVNYQGLKIAIENKEGSVRKWTDVNGETGETKMTGVSYGYVKGTLGADEDEIDVFVGPDPRAENAYVIEQQNPHNGIYDEQKVFVGFGNQEAAENAYKLHYNNPETFIISIQPMTIDAFKRWIAQTKPVKGVMCKSEAVKSIPGPRLVLVLPSKE